ncbi:DUF222 domain-containing protein [Kribbella sp. NPDC058693]|uniref:HNH endonuclease signature motif containing protein n=1 Tax=Kribbella sp. NPDC058693 TaxID=3346602 RepID=UPI00366A4114
MDLLDERPAWSMSGGELLAALDAVDADIARKETYRLQLVARIDETGYAEELGARDAVELLTLRHRQNRRDAYRDVKLARALPKYRDVSAALVEGTPAPGLADAGPADRGWLLRPAQAAAIVSALERVRSRVPVEDLDVAEKQLVGLAAHLSPDELRATAKQICDLLDSDSPEPDEHKAYARESLTLAPAENGVKFRGYLANENAELLRSLIHAGARPHKTIDGELDPRPRDKRQADALSSALTIAATATDAGCQTRPANDPPSTRDAGAPAADAGKDGWTPGFGAKANITVTIDFHDLKAATANATGQLVYGDGLSAATIRRLACDARILPLVLGSNSEPLDVGRSERLVTRAMRRALNARDKGCVVCGAPPIMCDAHHVKSWIEGGETNIENLALLCRRHHTDLHNGHWTITITAGVVNVSRPAWADPPPNAARPGFPSDAIRPGSRSGPAHAPSDPLAPALPHSTSSWPERPERNATTTPPEPTTTASVREATYRAIWGEDPTPQTEPPTSGRITSSCDQRFDPWAETPTAPTGSPRSSIPVRNERADTP